MVNPHRGEVEILLDGHPHAARLTLGALAELEHSLGTGSLLELVKRFEVASFNSADVLAVLVAGLRGGGWRGTADDLLTVDVGGGTVAAASSAAALLTLAFKAGT